MVNTKDAQETFLLVEDIRESLKTLDFTSIEKEAIMLNNENGVFAEYFDNHDLDGEPIVRRYEKNLNFSWINGPSHPKLKQEYSVRYINTFSVSVPWPRTFNISSRGGVRSYLDGELFVNEWENQTPDYIEKTKMVYKRL